MSIVFDSHNGINKIKITKDKRRNYQSTTLNRAKKNDRGKEYRD
jgi:hypothetical protein